MNNSKVCYNTCGLNLPVNHTTVIDNHFISCSLREVELFGCFNLTVKTATALANHCKGLINLNVGQLWKLTDTSVAQLSGSLGLIETLNISGCKQASNCLFYNYQCY